jgi:putative transposase
LCINRLDNIVTLRRLIESYVNEHNQRMPQNAFDGQTPDEMYFGRGATIPDELAEKGREARTKRSEQRQHFTCGECSRRARDADRDIAA